MINKIKRDKNTSGLIIFKEVSFGVKMLSMDSRATMLLILPGFILYFLLLMIMKNYTLIFIRPAFIDYFMPFAVLEERHIELF